VRWNDPQLGIDWGIDPAGVILSKRDQQHPLLKDVTELF